MNGYFFVLEEIHDGHQKWGKTFRLETLPLDCAYTLQVKNYLQNMLHLTPFLK